MNKLRIVIAGGTGQVGTVLARHFHRHGHAVVVIARHLHPAPWPMVSWSGNELGPWAEEINKADVVINLAGRSVNCRYTEANRREIIESRVHSTRIIGEAIANAPHPPRLWLNASTATIYRHALDREMDESTGELGGSEPGDPSSWNFSIDVAKSWEKIFFAAQTPRTRKIAMRSAMVMGPDKGGIFATLLNLARIGLGGRAGSGQQFMSWIHDADFIRAVEFLIAREELDGCINICSPFPLPNRDFMAALRRACGIPFGLPAANWMIEIGTFFLRTESELILKSRRVVPGRLLNAGFEFLFPQWPDAAQDLVNTQRREPQPKTFAAECAEHAEKPKSHH